MSNNDMGEFARLTAQATVFIGPATLVLAGQTVEGDSLSCIVPAPSVTSPRFTATVTDGVGGTAAAEFRLSIGYATLDFLAGGKGIAFGTTATEEGFVCAMPAKFLGGVEGIFPLSESADHPGCFCRTVDGRTEWLNPPMVLGQEYCTLRRYNGERVYTKLVDLGTLPNKTTKFIDGVISGGWKLFVDIHPVSKNDISALKVSGYGDGTWAWLELATTADLSSKTAQCILQYLK